MGQWLRALMSRHGVKLHVQYQLFDQGQYYFHLCKAQCPYLLNAEIGKPASLDSCENQNCDDSFIVLKYSSRATTKDQQMVMLMAEC